MLGVFVSGLCGSYGPRWLCECRPGLAGWVERAYHYVQLKQPLSGCARPEASASELEPERLQSAHGMVTGHAV